MLNDFLLRFFAGCLVRIHVCKRFAFDYCPSMHVYIRSL